MTVRPKASCFPEIGQLLIVGFEGTQLAPRLASLLTRLQPAGVILFARNIQSAQQTWELLRDCQRCVSQQLFACVDLEGGTVDRLRDALSPAPSAADAFAAGGRTIFCKHGQLIGESCRAFGFNLNFAPVLDLACEASRKVMAWRTVSANPRETAAYAREFLAGLRAARVLGCGKHFPGLGEGELDSHHQLPVIEKSLKQLWREDLLPYRLLRMQLPLVMVAHAAYPEVTNDRTPASLSQAWITEILRKKIGYRNLIVSDDLEMGGVLSAAPLGEAAVEFVRAGGDLCLVCHREDWVLEAYEELTKAAERHPGFAKRAAESARRIAAFKKKHEKILRPGKKPNRANVQALSRKLWEFGEQVRLKILASKKSQRADTLRYDHAKQPG